MLDFVLVISLVLFFLITVLLIMGFEKLKDQP
jgi:hypothetical protein